MESEKKTYRVGANFLLLVALVSAAACLAHGLKFDFIFYYCVS